MFVSIDVSSRKKRILSCLRTIVRLIREGVEHDFAEKSLSVIPIESENLAKFKKLMAEEKQLLDEKIKLVTKNFEERLQKAHCLEEVEEAFLQVRNNIQVGIYSPIERERRKANGIY